MKKILAFSDVHCKTRHCERILQQSQDADIVVGAGDFASFRKNLDKAWDVLKQIEKPFVIVPGNHESLDELRKECEGLENVHVLHGSGIEIEGVSFYGIGGGIPVTPFGKWSYDFSEEAAIELLADMPEGGVFVSHSPPKGTLDSNYLFMSLGSTTVRDTILERKPKICICGHIHERSGKSKMLETTQVVNAGPKGMMLEYGDE